MAEEGDSDRARGEEAHSKTTTENTSNSSVPQLLLTTANVIPSNSHTDQHSDSDSSISVTDNDLQPPASTSMSEDLQASQAQLEVSTSLQENFVESRPRRDTITVLPNPRRISPHSSPYPSRDTNDPSPSLSVSTHSSPPTVMFSDGSAGMDSNGVMLSNTLGGQHFEPINIDTMDHSEDMADSSPEMVIYENGVKAQNRVYKCRFCSFTAATYTQLQLHMPRHGGVKALKCPLCDYSTNDKSNFRRHRRLHIGNNPVSVLKCEKCSYSTILPRKFREHYSQVHNVQIGTNFQYQTSPYRPCYDNAQYRVGPIEVAPAPSQSTISSSNNLSATNALHSLLRGIHTTPVQYSHIPNHAQPIPGAQCIGQYGGYPTPVRRSSEENHMASNYLRSIVSSIMNNPQPTQQLPSASSTISSSSFYVAAEPNQPPIQRTSSTRMSTLLPMQDHQVKVKVEPPERSDTPDVPDVSSTAPPTQHQIHMMERGRQMSMHGLSRSYSESGDHSMVMECNEATTSAEFNRSNSADSGPSFHRGDNGNPEHGSSADNLVNTTVKLEMSNVGIQCSLPIIKSESCVVGSSDRLTTVSSVERGVQCEIMASVRCINQRSQSLASESDFTQEQQSFNLADNRCNHCGITFDDEVLYSIHLGCHSHTDPFVCNVCGKHCGNKYGFYSHIMRGHHY